MAKDLNQLIELAEKYGTDKAGHGYLPYYAKHLPSTCESFLEVGAYKGASLRMWKDLYPEAEISCFDLFLDPDNISKEDVEKMGVKAYQGDQGYTQDLNQIEGEFDVIIEDGSHRSDHQIITLNALWPKVKPGGVYVVEDLHCCNEPFYWAGDAKHFDNTMLGQLKSIGCFPLPKLTPFKLYDDKIAFFFKSL